MARDIYIVLSQGQHNYMILLYALKLKMALYFYDVTNLH